MSDTQLRSQLQKIAEQFHIFECTPCAIALRQYLSDRHISGRQLSLFTGSTEDPFCNIYHEVLGRNIATNGRHEAIGVDINGQELIFDNLHPEGISRVNWINNLYCAALDLGGSFQIQEIPF